MNEKMGDEIEVGEDQIADWMYVENGKLVGGYMLRARRNRLPEDERAEFDKSLPCMIE